MTNKKYTKKQEGLKELKEKYSKLKENIESRVESKAFNKAWEINYGKDVQLDIDDIIEEISSAENGDERLVMSNYLKKEDLLPLHQIDGFEGGMGYIVHNPECGVCKTMEDNMYELGLTEYMNSKQTEAFGEVRGITGERINKAYDNLTGEHSKKIRKALEQKIQEEKTK